MVHISRKHRASCAAPGFVPGTGTADSSSLALLGMTMNSQEGDGAVSGRRSVPRSLRFARRAKGLSTPALPVATRLARSLDQAPATKNFSSGLVSIFSGRASAVTSWTNSRRRSGPLRSTTRTRRVGIVLGSRLMMRPSRTCNL